MKNSKLSSGMYDISLQRSLQVFEESIKSDVTRKGYKKRLENFLKFTTIKDYDSLAKTDHKTLQKLVENYVIQLKQKHRLGKLRANSFPTYLAPIELFCVQNDIILNFKKVKRMFPQREKLTGEQPFTIDDISKMLKNSTIRWRAIIHFLASTGIRPGAIFDLQLKHIKELEDDCLAVKIYADDPQEYWVFLTPEATRALREYFDKRKFDGEKMNSESPVFRNHYREAMAWHDIKKISSTSFYTTLAKIQERAGIRNRFSLTKERHDKRIVYGFRKRYNTVMKLKKEVNSNIAEKLMGHKNGLDGVYFTPTIEECLEEFKKVIPELTVSDELRQKMMIKQQEKKISELEQNQMKIQHLEQGVNIIGALFAEQRVKSKLSKQLEHPTHHHTKEQDLNLEKYVKSPPSPEVWKAFLEWSQRGSKVHNFQ